MGSPPGVSFDLELPHGRCVGLPVPEGDALASLAGGTLLPAEQAYARTLPLPRRATWVAGRAALRLALQRLGLEAPATLADDRGAPALPPGTAGSISHKQALAVALVAREAQARLGVDVELDVPGRVDVSRRVLTDDELEEIAPLPPEARAREVVLRFSAKEAVYKAIDPFVRRYVGFHEVRVRPLPSGAAEVRMGLPAADGELVVEVRWLRRDGVVLTTARAERP